MNYVDSDRYPLVELKTPRLFEPGEVGEYMAQIEAFMAALETDTRFALLLDSTPADKIPDALSRKRMSEHATRMEELGAGRCVGTALLVRSAAVRTALTGVLWVYRPKIPLEVANSRTAAERWCRERLAGAQVSPR